MDRENSSHRRFLGSRKDKKFKTPSGSLTKRDGNNIPKTTKKEPFSNLPLIFSAKRNMSITRRKENTLFLEDLKAKRKSQKEKRNREKR
jgi:hypothetical protein